MIALYIRLSHADGDLSEEKLESNSIQNQRKLLHSFIKGNKEFAIIDFEEFVDDGYSGTDFNRPAFKSLIEKIKIREIDTVIVKDFSRFGRDYIDTGEYLEKLFPILGVRFISINDGYDSGKNVNDNQNFEMVVKNIVNSFYSKDISLKIASADKMRQKNAMYLGGHRIYGFLKDPKDTHKVVVDPVASLVVRKIFELAIEGKTTTQIADILNKEKVITPAQYLAQIKIISGKNKTRDIKDSSWNQTMIYRTLQNREYKGDYVGRKTKRISPCSKKSVPTSKEEQIIIQHAHDAIVTEEEFELANKVITKLNKHKNTKDTIDYPLKGKVRCGNCNHVMRYYSRTKTDNFFCCGYNKPSDTHKCCKEPISEAVLSDILYRSIIHYLELIDIADTKLLELEENNQGDITKISNQIKSIDSKIKKLQSNKINMYEEYAKDRSNREKYIKSRSEIERQIHDLSTEKEMLKNKLSCYQNNDYAEIKMMKNAKDRLKSNENGEELLTREMVEAFVDSIFVYDECRLWV